MDQVHKILDRGRTLATTLVSYLLLGQVAVSAVMREVGDDVPQVIEYGTPLVAVLGSLILIVRRVTPAAKADRGLTSPSS